RPAPPSRRHNPHHRRCRECADYGSRSTSRAGTARNDRNALQTSPHRPAVRRTSRRRRYRLRRWYRNLVTRNPGEGKAWPLTFHGKTVTVTPPAGLDTDPHLALLRLRHLALNQFKRTATLRHLYRPHLSHRPPLYRVRLHFTPTYSSWLNQVEL